MILTVHVPKDLWLTSNRHTTNRPHRARVVRDLHNLTVDAWHHIELELEEQA